MRCWFKWALHFSKPHEYTLIFACELHVSSCGIVPGAQLSNSLIPCHHAPRKGSYTLGPTLSAIINRVLLTPQLLALATDELSIRVGETLAGLLNATLVRPSFSLKPLPSSISQNLVPPRRVTREFFCQFQLRPRFNRFRTSLLPNAQC